MDPTKPLSRLPLWSLAALLLLCGCALRIVPWTSFHGMAYDESWYRKYLHALDAGGLAAYPEICAAYLEDGKDENTMAKVPPTRALFVSAGWLWKRLAFGDAPPANVNLPDGPDCDPALISLHRVSTLFSCLGLCAVWAFARRLRGEVEALAVLALCACSPLLIHTSQHALIDGVCGTCALFAFWTLWESMQPGAHSRWLVGYGISYALLVLAKENAAFPAFAFALLMLFGRHLGFGQADRSHWFATILGGLTAIVLLSAAAGGSDSLVNVYRLLICKAQMLPYAHDTGGGPWSRYLVDLLLLTPVTLCFALGGGFRALSGEPRTLGLLIYLAASYAVMCNVHDGMNLRYTTIWDFPIRALAVIQAAALAALFPHPRAILAVCVALLCAIDLAQYRHFFVTYRMHELPTADLLRAEKMLK